MYQSNPPRAEYVPTKRGKELGKVVRALRDWGAANTAAPARRKPKGGPD